MDKRLNQIAQALYNKKGFNILTLDVRGISTLTDYFVIAEGTVKRHVKALADAVTDVLSKEGIDPVSEEGMHEGDWIVLDFGDIMVHLFMPELRQKYTLEQMWHDGKVVDVDIALENVG